jgi:hypothetical protein
MSAPRHLRKVLRRLLAPKAERAPASKLRRGKKATASGVEHVEMLPLESWDSEAPPIP